LSFGRAATIVAAAIIAFTIAALAHEGIGHGGACLLLGGHLNYVSTTFADCSLRSYLIDGAGPVAGLLMAFLCWLLARNGRYSGTPRGAFLIFGFAFAAFWNLGYLIQSGLIHGGDWYFVATALFPASGSLTVMALLGIAAYAAAIKICVRLFKSNAGAQGGPSPLFTAVIAYIAPIFAMACAAYFDPRGPQKIWSDAVPEAAAAIGLIVAAGLLARKSPDLRFAIAPSPAWLAGGAVSAGILIMGLGPGLHFG
jgi:hypothetical protein